ncbi:hypothetical protein H257_03328 [Aphanomyces astaci]|uniref:DDE-1 domain-containing protein n=1 Tax=Aphanomyces astaci TaxID=112090 RepID=W4GY42_APHAT|nr:hypothetical protein H257_03328 [Aphanomyces astaci]ETV83949.1 hypothetical protein H257_03328 [Aphanomyces astaci]|eukprot:XP_009825641.1 hypothetical protein H257_03328 [Aphanomyces astaci]
MGATKTSCDTALAHQSHHDIATQPSLWGSAHDLEAVEVEGGTNPENNKRHGRCPTMGGQAHRAGVKLPLLFIVKGKPGGPTDKLELLQYEDASVLMVDNLDCHVSEESHKKVAETLFSVVEPLPKNWTSQCQSLDVVNHGEHSTPNATKRTYKRIPLSAKKRIVDAFNNAMDWKRVAQVNGVNISSARNWLHLDSLTSKQRGESRLLTEENVDMLQSWVEHDVQITLQEIKDRLALDLV